VACFGTIEKNYHERRAYSDISIYMNCLRCIFCGLIACLYRLYTPASARPRSQPPKPRHKTAPTDSGMLGKPRQLSPDCLEFFPSFPRWSGPASIVCLACLSDCLTEITSAWSGIVDHIPSPDRSVRLFLLYVVSERLGPSSILRFDLDCRLWAHLRGPQGSSRR